MNICVILFAGMLLLFSEGYAAPRRTTYDETSILLREMQDTVDNLRHEVSNHETELKMFEERLQNEENRLDTFRQQITDGLKAQKDLVKGNSISLEERILALDSAQKSLASDLRQFKTHANETAVLLGQYQKQLAGLEKVIEAQNQNIEHLQTALQSLMEVMQIKAKGADASGTYTVKAGDSLDKIAKSHRTTVQAIKELNNLTKDRIIVGQTLKIPE